MTRVPCRLRVNGAAFDVEIAPAARLVDVLRGPLGLLGVKEGCGNGECGSCTVLVGGRALCACLTPALEVEDAEIVTIEGLAGAGGPEDLHPVQRAFVDECGIQCGFCTPGMILAAVALLARDPDPGDRAIRDALRGNLCRCTGYAQIVEAVRAAAADARASGATARASATEARHG